MPGQKLRLVQKTAPGLKKRTSDQFLEILQQLNTKLKYGPTTTQRRHNLYFFLLKITYVSRERSEVTKCIGVQVSQLI